jgi:hypothetical protein
VHLGCWGDGDLTPPTVKLLWLEYACRKLGSPLFQRYNFIIVFLPFCARRIAC